MSEIGVFLCGGGNKVLFGDGFLNELESRGIKPDYWTSKSASGGIMIGQLLGRSNELLRIFLSKCRKNKKNFYLLRREHFPHDRMLRTSLLELIDRYGMPRGNYGIVASQTSLRLRG